MTIDQLFAIIHPLNPKFARDLWQAWLASDPRARGQIELAAKAFLEKNVGEDYRHEPVLLAPPPATIAAGDYPLGQVTYAGRDTRSSFGLREDEWIQHVAIFGRSGSGKTNLGAVIIEQLVEARKPFIVLDWKRNYRDLLPRIPQLHVLTAGREVVPFHFNPWIPPTNTPRDVWLKKLVEVMAHAYFAGEGVIDILLRAGDRAYRACGDENPTTQDVLAFTQEIKESARQAQWKASALRVLRSLDYGPMQRVTRTHDNDQLASLLSGYVILEVDTLADSDKTFLAEALLLWIMQSRLRSNERREEFKHAIMIEEAHHLFLKRPADFTGQPITDVLLREVRELGEAVILLDQHPSLISLPALGNTNTTIAFNLKTEQDVLAASRAVLLEREQMNVLGKLPVGHAVARVQGRHPAPFTVRVPLVEIAKGSVTDEDISRPSRPVVQGIAAKTKLPDLDPPRQLLADVALYPFSELLERYQRLGWSPKQGTRYLAATTDWLRPVFLVRRDKKVKLLSLTKTGRDELARLGIAHAFPNHLTHTFWATTITTTLSHNGYTIEHEAHINGYADLVAAKDSKKYAIEVETGKSDYVSNVAKCLANPQFTRVICVATSAKVARQMLPALRKRGFIDDKRFVLTVANTFDC